MGKKFKKLLAAVLSLILLATLCTAPMTASAEDTKLRFGEDGKFKIVVFSDVQDQYPVHQRVIRIMEQAIARENPDLVVFTGDITEINTKDPEVDYRRTVEQIIAPVVEAGVPYAITFGNHDPQSYFQGQVTSKDAMLAVWQSIGDCRTTDPAPELTGTGTCKVPIYASDSDDLAFNLWMVDSNSYQNPLDTTSGYDNPHADQLAWMAANNDAGVNSLVFQHIPMPETYNLFVEDENGTKTYGDKKYRLELKEGVTGTAGEFPATIYANDNTGEFQTLKEMGNVLGVFNGHDHLNDFSGVYDGIGITSIPGMSYFNYGDEAIRGYGVIELDEADLSTYDYHTVKFSTLDAESGISTETTYDVYDEITYADLKENGNALGDSYTINGGHTFTYDATSPSYSAIFKYRWTAGSKPGYQVSFDLGNDGNISYPFGLWIKRADQTGPNGAWHLKPNVANLEVKMNSAVSQGETYDIEIGRLKVLTGTPQYVGMYYVYLKVNGVLIQEGYTNTDENGGYISDGADCQISNVIRFGGWGNGGDDKISASPFTEAYEDYDEITYEDLIIGGNPANPAGIDLGTTREYTYNATSKTFSTIFKYRWIAGTSPEYSLYYDYWGNYPFGLAVKGPNSGKGGGATAGENGAWHVNPSIGGNLVNMDEPIVAGQAYDIEFARLKVKNGENKGLYYVYLKVDGELVHEYYVEATEELTNKILFVSSTADNSICATPENYVHDEITYDDLIIGGNPAAPEGIDLGTTREYTYTPTSETYSTAFKFRWTAGVNPEFSLYFDYWGNYPFGLAVKGPNSDKGGGIAAGENGAWHVNPAIGGNLVNMSEPIVEGRTYDIEFGRIKVKTGVNGGKYNVYLKVNDELIQSYYTDATEELTNKILFVSSTEDNFIFGYPEEEEPEVPVDPEPDSPYYAYDEITYADLFIGGNPAAAEGIDLGTTREYTYNATSETFSTIFKYRWIAGTSPEYSLYYDYWGNYPFGLAVKGPNSDKGGGIAAGENGAWHVNPSIGGNLVNMSEPIVAGKAYDIEFARLKVKNGDNAGKYHVYLKVDGELVHEYYVEATEELTNKILFVSSTADNSICASPVPETYEAYDDLSFDSLFIDGISMSGMEMDGSRNYTYNATSPSYSMKLKFRWTAGSEPRFTVYLDDWVFPFCFAAKLPNQADFGATAGANGAWHLVPSNADLMVNMDEAIVPGQSYDIEIGRLKVATGENTGKYYVYFMVDGQPIQYYYYDGVVDGAYAGTPLSNKIIVSSPDGNKFSAAPVPEVYEAYDDLTFNDLFVGDISMAGQTMTSNQEYTYNATSPTYSMKLKYRWIAGGSEMKFTTFLDDWVYPFCFAAKTPNQADFGATAGPNGAWHLVPSNNDYIVQMDEPIVSGQAYDIEIGRLKVASGPNAGKYYVYFMVDGELIKSYYYDGVVNGVYEGTALSNNIIISIPDGNKITATPFVEEYEAYDEIGLSDLKDANGNALEGLTQLSGATVFTYDRTSPTSSAIFKFRWKIGTAAKFQMSFDKASSDAMSYMFGAWLDVPSDEYSNGKMWLRPAYGPQVNMPDALVAGTSHNVEFARLKVANGSNAGKYYVYIKIDDVLVAEDYVAANVVDANGVYTTDPGPADVTLSNEILFAFWGSEGNAISAYKDLGSSDHEGTVGDFNDDGVINATDLATLKRILLKLENLDEMPEGIADFNADSAVNILDLIAMKKHLIAANSYERSGALALGTQEHLLEDYSKTADYIADASATLGASAYRLSEPIHKLYYATSANGVAVNEANMADFKEMVAALKANGIDEILYVTDSFILPYGYADPEKNHNKTVPDPVTDTENYVAWLTVNAAAFKALAQEVPEIKYFEPYNEPNVAGNRLERYGIGWNATEEEKAAHKFTVKEKAGIMADLCWYISRAVKSVDTANQVTTPSISVDTNSSNVEGDFLDELYKAIEAGTHPTNRVVADKRVDNYFTIVNIHSYITYTNYTLEYQAQTRVNDWADRIKAAYDVIKAHNDGDSRVWLTETGMSTYEPNGNERNETKVAKFISLELTKLNSELTFVDTVFMYKIADISSDNGASPVETYYGLFRSGDDLDNPYAAKPSAEAVYSFFHNGSTDYSALDALVGRYA